MPDATRRVLAEASRVFLRTARHPAAGAVEVGAESFDELYERAEDFEALYGAIVDALVVAAQDVAASGGFVAYAVPGSPLVAERSVAMLRADGRVEVEVVPAPSFLDLAWDRLGVDPVEMAVRVVDAASFARDAAGDPGPLLVAP